MLCWYSQHGEPVMVQFTASTTWLFQLLNY
jgi:hypothetical protein